MPACGSRVARAAGVRGEAAALGDAVDLAVVGGTVLTPAGPCEADVLLAGGRVAALVPRAAGAAAPPAADVLDAVGCLVLPGAIDPHVHFREPGLRRKEDWEHASLAAVAGGVTTVLDMPNVVPPTDDASALAAKAASIAGRSRCHFGLYGGLRAGGASALPGLAEAGAIGVKVFLGETTASLPPPDDGELLEALRTAARLGLRVMAHAENGALLAAAGAYAAGGGGGDLRRHGRARPAVAEREAVARFCLLAAEAGAPVAVAHLSCAGAVAEVRWRKAAGGADLRAEACPHHLLLTEDEVLPFGALGKVNPPLRGAADLEALWAAVADGTVDWVGSDHAPHAPEEKGLRPDGEPDPAADVARAAAGFAGVQNTVGLLWAEVARGRLGLRRLVELCCEAPARAWGLWPRKGRIAVGADADLAVWRPQPPPVPPRQWSLHPWSPLLRLRHPGATLVATVVGGQVAFRDGAPVGAPRGCWLRPTR